VCLIISDPDAYISDYSHISWLYVFVLISSVLTSIFLRAVNPGIPFWPSLASYVPERGIYFLSRRPFGLPGLVLCCYHIIRALPAFLLRFSLRQFLLLCAALTIELDLLRVLRFVSFFLTGLLMPLSCIKPPYSFSDHEVTNFGLFQSGSCFRLFCQGIFRHALWVFFIPDIFSLNAPG
jgi:hypothetical protein